MKKRMYMLCDRPYGKLIPCAYCYDNGYYVYQVVRDDEKFYNEKLFKTAEEAVDVLYKLKRNPKCQLIN